ncbi:MAG: hypothetical protein AB7N54_07515 [Alphaproteobacteria bacterium]
MTAARKFLFERSFDERVQRVAEARRFDDADLARAREEGFADGHAAGEAAARDAHAEAIGTAVSTIADAVTALAADREAAFAGHAAEATSLVLAICRKLMPALARTHALGEIEALVRDCLMDLDDEPRVVVRVPDALLDVLQDRIEALGDGFDGRLVLLGDDAMAPSDCSVMWADGGAERDLDRLWRDIDRAVERVTAAAETNGSATPVAPAAD